MSLTFPIQFDIYKSDSKRSLVISSALITISILSLCECITHSSSLSLEGIKLITIVN